jgi:hypothetical protein
MSADLQPLLAGLEVLHGAGPEFDDFLANHGPMACEALVQLGIGDRAPEWARAYRPRLEGEATPRRVLDPHDYRHALGRVDLLGDWIALLRKDVAELSRRTVLTRWWQRLLPGMAAACIHGVIRTPSCTCLGRNTTSYTASDGRLHPISHSSTTSSVIGEMGSLEMVASVHIIENERRSPRLGRQGNTVFSPGTRHET